MRWSLQPKCAVTRFFAFLPTRVIAPLPPTPPTMRASLCLLVAALALTASIAAGGAVSLIVELCLCYPWHWQRRLVPWSRLGARGRGGGWRGAVLHENQPPVGMGAQCARRALHSRPGASEPIRMLECNILVPPPPCIHGKEAPGRAMLLSAWHPYHKTALTGRHALVPVFSVREGFRNKTMPRRRLGASHPASHLHQ
jgi:hypothetical protein